MESLPVSKDIKRKRPHRAAHVAAHEESLRNLAACGLGVVCYNFVPVLDWTRTALCVPMEHDGTAMAFDLVDFAAFDLFVLKRPGAGEEYEPETIDTARRRGEAMSDADRRCLLDNIVMGLPGAAESWTLDELCDQLGRYSNASDEELRRNLADFLVEVTLVAEALGLRLCCHSDDPPFPLLKLSRVMSSAEDHAWLIADVDLPANGITLRIGSLGVRPEFDGDASVRRLGHRIHFAHLRNTRRQWPLDGGRHSVFEAAHPEGDMVVVVKALVDEKAQRGHEGRDD